MRVKNERLGGQGKFQKRRKKETEASERKVGAGAGLRVGRECGTLSSHPSATPPGADPRAGDPLCISAEAAGVQQRCHRQRGRRRHEGGPQH